MATQHKTNIIPGLGRFDCWLREIGRTSTTGYRWRKRGWIKVLNIGGRGSITDKEIARFILRGQDDEFFRRTLEAATTSDIKRKIRASFQQGGTKIAKRQEGYA